MTKPPRAAPPSAAIADLAEWERRVQSERAEVRNLGRTVRQVEREALASAKRDDEHGEQALLFQWRELRAPTVPALELLYAIPNFAGFLGTSDKARERAGARLNAEGRRKGMLDVCLPVARGGWHALYVEMKTAVGRLTVEQRGWVDALRAAGNRVEVCRSADEAIAVITEYLSLTPAPCAPSASPLASSAPPVTGRSSASPRGRATPGSAASDATVPLPPGWSRSRPARRGT